MLKVILICLFICFLAIPLFGEQSRVQKDIHESGPIGTANPAAVYCKEMGYKYEVINEPSGQRGVCIFPDGSECDEWAFLQGKCGGEHSYCTKCGYGIKTLTDGKNPFSREYAVCVSKQGEQIGPVTELMSLSNKVTKGINYRQSLDDGKAYKQPLSDIQTPPSFDWRNHNGYNWMTPVKDQGWFGTCWAFSAVGTVEAMENIWRNNPNLNLDLSEHYLVSCLPRDPYGGDDIPPLFYIAGSGIPDENCFPYYPHAESLLSCSEKCADWRDRLIKTDSTKYVTFSAASPVNMKQYISEVGPIDAMMSMYGYWDGDIYRCDSTAVYYHGIVIVGYDDVVGYWIAKNSWGTSWGDGGYFKIGYGECTIESWPFWYYKNNIDCGCGIARNTILDKDLNCPDGWDVSAIQVIADSIVLDCDGHLLECSGCSDFTIGVRIMYNAGVTVKNCNIKGFRFGAILTQNTKNSFVGNTFRNGIWGVYLRYGGEPAYQLNTFWNNRFLSNSINAQEYSSSTNNSWNLGDTGNYWSDFKTNIGYPDSYVVSGPGGGVDHYPQKPPGLFSLLSPGNNASVTNVVVFDWANATDSDAGDTVRYGLYVGTSSNFHPDSTIIRDGLLISNYSDTLNPGVSYWKVKAYDKLGLETWSTQTWRLQVFPKGDANGDGKFTVSDVVYIINYLFKGGPSPNPLLLGDANCDGKLNVSDVIFLINYLFKGGPKPPC